MADYYPLIARAVAGLEKNTGDARRVLYERARTALVTQLRGVNPALNELDVTRERLALEEAIRKVEADAARKRLVPSRDPTAKVRPPDASRWEEARSWDAPAAAREPPLELGRRPSPPRLRPQTRPPYDNQGDRPPPDDEVAPPPRGRLRPSPDRRSLLDAGLKDFRGVVSEANELGEASARASQSARDTFAAVPDPVSDYQHSPDMQMLEQPPLQDFSEQMHEPSFPRDDLRPLPPRMRTSQSTADDADMRLPRRSYRDLVKIAIALFIVCGIAGLSVWQWPNMVAFYRYLRTPATEVAVEAPSAPQRTKIPDRVEPGGGQQSAPQTGAAPGAAVAQRVVLYEEDPADPAGKRYVGSAIWRTETISPGPNQPPELAIRADVEIPDRKIAMTWSLRRNTDASLPASHTIEIMFKLPTDFAGGSISNVPGILMKQAEQTRGVPLAGLAVKVTNGFFLIGLSAVEADRERNIQLLKERAWFDIPVVYANNRRAILALEKGTPGERVFADAFAAWKQ